MSVLDLMMMKYYDSKFRIKSKSMTSFQNSSIWQDVYYKQAKNIDLYIKLQITQNAIIISFKERT
jgi:hypothetical protein